MESEALDFIFPVFAFNGIPLKKDILEKIIWIPTEKKITGSEIMENIPCLFIRNTNSKNILIIFHCNGVDMFEIFYDICEYSEKYGINIP